MISILLKLKKLIRSILPEWIFLVYHFLLAHLAVFYYGYPAKKLFVVGVTGTKGKTSTANFVWAVLTAGGYKTGQLGTANTRIGEKQTLNRMHMTMPSPFVIQKFLKQMVAAGCTHAVMEATSEGLKLFRHLGIKFDAAIFTNLTPEHLPSHGGSFEKYKQVKAQLMKNLTGEKIIIANADSEYAKFYLGFPAKQKITFGIKQGDLLAENIIANQNGISFAVKNQPYRLSVLGSFNVYNALPAIALGQTLKIGYEQIKQGLENLKLIEGRMQKIEQGQNFTVIVDYAHEKVSMNAALDAVRSMAPKHHVIVLLGAEGGGRDQSKRPAMGEVAATKADFVIISNVDPYDDDPLKIANDIAQAAESSGKTREKNLFIILDRKAGIAQALGLARAGDVVLITGKGAEQSMIIGSKKIPWDDREMVKEELQKLLKQK
ncbi:MAG: UDP-N-acetylmuramoyl-L-alanyl-D-glutamate--2,6-diaminopimelate ligase [Candidatus Doudnabacteria bacterium]|nr:UDP-N-acetylmuramoyl-L-alanyl-D-glutamate--2,6-diaminopimelate ligase [Candidatus Doudnabacteria bacterium]